MSIATPRLKLRRPDTCAICARALGGGEIARRGPARCVDCEGELARELERVTARGVVVLRGKDVDHIAIGPAGITLIDEKRYRGRIAVECSGGLLRDRIEHLVVGGLDCSELVDGVLARAEAVRQALPENPPAPVPVRAVLCFVDGDWPWSGELEVRGVPVVAPRRAAKLCATGHLPAEAVKAVADVLAARLVPA